MTWLGIIITLVLLATAIAYLLPAIRPDKPPPPAQTDASPDGVTVFLCHSVEDDPDWGAERADELRAAAAEIGFDEYVQLHRRPRWSLVYVALRLSRSWPVAALVSLLHGLPVPSLRAAAVDESAPDWDVVEVFTFRDAGIARRWLEEDGGFDGPPPRRVVMTATRQVRLGTGLASETSVIFFLKARAFLGREAMLDYWLGSHRARVIGLQPALDFTLYQQMAAEHPDQPEDPDQPWDGVARLDYAGISVLRNGIVNPRVQAANLNLVWDETRFIDFGASHLFLAETRARILGAGRE